MTQSRFVEVEFKNKRRGYFQNLEDTPYEPGSYVLVETENESYNIGITLQSIVADIYGDKVGGIKKVMRLADANEIEDYLNLLEKQKTAANSCNAQIKMRQLKMKLIDVDCQLDGSKITFYFTAERRVDFRELVKALAGIFKTRIELRQVGVRDEAKRLDGIGPCGKRLCCVTFLKDFAPITLKMAREQHISLTPSKISGVCGRLLCCLEYEHELYKTRARIFPAVGSKIETTDGMKLTVSSIEFFKDGIVGQNQDGIEVRIGLKDIKRSEG